MRSNPPPESTTAVGSFSEAILVSGSAASRYVASAKGLLGDYSANLTQSLSVPGLDNPRVFYQVLQNPAPLAGMSLPTGSLWGALASAGFRSVVCLTSNNAPYDPAPLQILCAAKMEDLAGCLQPDDPEREAEILKSVVRFVVGELQSGRGSSSTALVAPAEPAP